MHKRLFLYRVVGLALPFLLVTVLGYTQSTLKTLKEIAGPPPASLDQYFPPKAPAPVWLLEMFNLAGPFEGIGVNLQDQDMPNVKASFQAFKSQYAKMSKMVPEWTSRFRQGPVTALGKAIDSGNPAQIGPAMEKMGQVCSDCHLLSQIKVQQKYHWRNYDDIKVTDPVSGRQLALPDFMTAMSGGYEGALVDLQQGQLDRSRQHFQDFRSQFNAMAAESCKQCHIDRAGNEIPRKYYVDAESTALLDQMGEALSASQPDAAAIANLAGAVGNSICLNCHLVHFPAQNTKDLWSTYQTILK